MADNTAFTPGSGATGATDDIGGVHYPRVKLALGADGTANDAVAGAGNVSTGVQRMTLAADDPAVVSLAAIQASTTDVAHDAADSGNPVKIGGYASAAAPAAVSGDGDRVNAWMLRNGAQATVITAAGALVGGDASNGLDVDVTRLPATLTKPLAGHYETVAASQTDQMMGATGATGDYLAAVLIIPVSICF